MTDSQRTDFPAFTEHRVPRDRGSLPDNSHIYDDLIPHLASAGRRTVSIDFLGFGASDKLDGAHYSFAQQLRDLEAVVEALGLERIIPVGHDAGGPTDTTNCSAISNKLLVYRERAIRSVCAKGSRRSAIGC